MVCKSFCLKKRQTLIGNYTIQILTFEIVIETPLHSTLRFTFPLLQILSIYSVIHVFFYLGALSLVSTGYTHGAGTHIPFSLVVKT